jgi:hypothetical protein
MESLLAAGRDHLDLTALTTNCVSGSTMPANPCEKRHSFLNFPYVCPEPVLVK